MKNGITDLEEDELADITKKHGKIFRHPRKLGRKLLRAAKRIMSHEAEEMVSLGIAHHHGHHEARRTHKGDSTHYAVERQEGNLYVLHDRTHGRSTHNSIHQADVSEARRHELTGTEDA